MFFHFQSLNDTFALPLRTTSSIGMMKFRSFAVWEVRREDEFSPLKNATGSKDTAVTSRHDLMQQHVRFLKKAGALLPYVL